MKYFPFGFMELCDGDSIWNCVTVIVLMRFDPISEETCSRQRHRHRHRGGNEDKEGKRMVRRMTMSLTMPGYDECGQKGDQSVNEAY